VPTDRVANGTQAELCSLAAVSDTRTHEATPHKLAQARARGDLAISADWAAAAVLSVACIWASFGAQSLWAALRALAHEALAGRVPSSSQGWALLGPLCALLGALPLAALLAIFAQRGFALGFRRSDRDDSGEGARQRLARVFGSDALHDLGIMSIKLCLLSAVLLFALRGSLPGLIDAWQRDPTDVLRLIAGLGRSLGWRTAATLAVIGLFDLLYRRWRRAHRLRMSRRELEHEQRDTEGDPRLVRERRARGRALLAQASFAELGAATLVIASASRTLALRYRPEHDAAPVLWLKADGALAHSLLTRAHALALPVHLDDALAYELYRLEPSQTIPEATHARVAALLVDRA
jgi:flagellar biosynthetic protein FlhB